MSWTYKLFNSIGLSVRADFYYNGKWTGLSSQHRSDVANLQAQADMVCNMLNIAEISDFRSVLRISAGNSGILVEKDRFSSISVYYWPKSPENAKNIATFQRHNLG